MVAARKLIEKSTQQIELLTLAIYVASLAVPNHWGHDLSIFLIESKNGKNFGRQNNFIDRFVFFCPGAVWFADLIWALEMPMRRQLHRKKASHSFDLIFGRDKNVLRTAEKPNLLLLGSAFNCNCVFETELNENLRQKNPPNETERVSVVICIDGCICVCVCLPSARDPPFAATRIVRYKFGRADSSAHANFRSNSIAVPNLFI